jgi:hypothetical protein
MRRLPILLVFALMFALLVLAPATADKPNCDPDLPDPPHPSCKTDDTTPTTTEPQGFVDCAFDDNGVLESWHGDEEDDRQCIWSLDDPSDASDTFSFQIESDPLGSVTKLKLAHLIVNADIVFPSDKCFIASQTRVLALPFPADSDDLWTFSPQDKGCGDDPYLLTISVQALKSGSVNLVMTQTSSG